MARPADFAGVAVTEAYKVLREIRDERRKVAEELVRVRAMEIRVQALSAALDVQAAAIGINHRWVGTQLEIRNSAGVWVLSPDLQGEKGNLGRWEGDTGMLVARLEINNASPTLELDVANYNEFDVLLSANVTAVDFVNRPDSPNFSRRVSVWFWQDYAGGHTVTGWPPPELLRWADGGNPPAVNLVPDVGTCLIFDVPGLGTDLSNRIRGFLADAAVMAPE